MCIRDSFRVQGTVQAGKEPGDTIPYHADIMKVSTDSVITDTTIVREGIVPSSAYPSLKDTTIMVMVDTCLLYTSPSPRDRTRSRMPSSA